MRRAAIVVFTLMGLILPASLAQDTIPGQQNDIELIKQGQQELRKELQEIRLLLIQKPTMVNAPPPLNVNGIEFELSDNPVLGDKAAQLILVDFTDYECPFCSRYHRETLPQIMKHYVDTGKIRYTIIDFPLPIHKYAAKAAEASLCARDQGKFWDMHRHLMDHQDSLGDLLAAAVAIGVEVNQFNDCMRSNKYGADVVRQVSIATKLGISGVPGFILAESAQGAPNKINGISHIRGAQPFSKFQADIDRALTRIIHER